MTKNRRNSICGCFAALVLAAAGWSASAYGQRPSPTPAVSPTPPVIKDDDEPIKIDTELVNIDVRVVDRNGRPIGNLQQRDFQVLENNEPQQIEFFSKSEVPTNYSLVVDNSGSLRQQLDKVIEASKIIVGTNKPEDETSVIRFVSRDKITIDQDFTANKADLFDALDSLYIEGGQTAIRDAVYLAAQRLSEYERSSGFDDRRRRALILITDGEDRDSYFSEAQLFEMLRESNIQIYVVGFINELDKDSGFIRKSDQAKARSFLERLAKETGGKAYFPAALTELTAIASDISSELRTQYSIGYLPSKKNDGTYRNIKVIVSDGPNKEKRIAVTRTGRNANRPQPEQPSTAVTPPKKDN
ncbi:MAG: VWA domain-containing protein [Pyrinomonadaceae bacterium]